MTGTGFPSGPLVAWYGDDFTGAAAVMEVLEFSGFPSVLFLGPPDAALLARFSGRRGIGIASDARTRGPDWMTQNLPTAFAALRATGAPVVHYKLCSTFDSSPDVGSIGRAAELGTGEWAPLVVAAPRIGRWQAFGNLFARHAEGIARLDRHPTMARHPVTPMAEADVRRHLAGQTDLPIGLIDLTDLQGGASAALVRERARGARVVAIDVVDAASLRAIGGLIWDNARLDQLFVLGSQGVEDALIAAWVADGHPLPPPRPAAAAIGPVAIISGSCAPETDRQIAAGEAAGFASIRLEMGTAKDAIGLRNAAETAEAAALAELAQGNSIIIYTARGPADPAIPGTKALLAAARQPDLVGQTLGGLLDRLHRKARLGRLAVAGGDTSGAVTAALGVVALTAKAEFVPAVPLLHAHGPDARHRPVELVLKGGQMGPDCIFAMIRDGMPQPVTA